MWSPGQSPRTSHLDSKAGRLCLRLTFLYVGIGMPCLFLVRYRSRDMPDRRSVGESVICNTQVVQGVAAFFESRCILGLGYWG